MNIVRKKSEKIFIAPKVKRLCWLKPLTVVLAAVMIMVFCVSCADSTPDDAQSTQSQSVNIPNPGTSQQQPAVSESANVYGNTAMNIANGGFVTIQGDWVYYNNTKGLYRIKIDGTGREFLSAHYAKGINVVGNYVYYRDTTEQGGGTGLWRLDLTAIDDPNAALLSLDERSSAYIYAVGDWVYYVLQTADTDKGLWRMKADGTSKEKIYYSTQKISLVNIQDDWIYFVNITPNHVNGIYKMKTDGTGLELIFETPDENVQAISFMVVIDDWIYYQNRSGVEDRRGIFKIKTDGTSQQPIFLFKTDVNAVNISGNWIYYYVMGDNGYELHKVGLDGAEELVCTVDKKEFICIIDDWAYTFKSGSSPEIHKMKLDGTDRQIVE